MELNLYFVFKLNFNVDRVKKEKNSWHSGCTMGFFSVASLFQTYIRGWEKRNEVKLKSIYLDSEIKDYNTPLELFTLQVLQTPAEFPVLI